MVAKIIKYKNKEYKYVINTEPDEYCDFCVFSQICCDVIQHKIAVEDSPMLTCIQLSDEFNTHFANFQQNT